jgi:hypothetical protein
MKAALRVVLLSSALVLVAPAVAGGRAPVGAPVSVRIEAADGAVDSAKSVRDAIVAAGQRHGWTVAKDVPGVLDMTLFVRGKHRVTVEVAYDTTLTTITYVSSENMDYKVSHGEPQIHSSYVRWVSVLAQEIRNHTRGL